MSLRILAALLVACSCAPAVAQIQPELAPLKSSAPEPGLLFYASGDKSFHADYAASGKADPNFLKDVKILPGGVKGSYMSSGDNQLLAWWAPGNIYAQRGTLSFFWRSQSSTDETEFPIFRVGYGDHSSWDMVWLRIDYNGHGFDAFVTDVNLNRTRVSTTVTPFPAKDVWTHIALTWDETSGIKFYVNGKLMATKPATGLFDTALDQFGPNSRIIAPTGVESSYNYDRGGDMDELRIYDRALSDANIAELAKNETPQNIPAAPEAADAKLRAAEWAQRYGWNTHDAPELLPAAHTTIRKVEIHDVYDLKRWSYKGVDGIRETTWPGVYNRSPLTGRFDYFQLPDWDCYAESGKSVVYYMPDEPWNHLEIEGGAWGKFDLLTPGNGDPKAVADPDQWDTTPQLAHHLFDRADNESGKVERTVYDLKQPVTGERLRFTNAKQWWPIGELGAYYVHPGDEPKGVDVLRYNLSFSEGDTANPTLSALAGWIDGRLPADERTIAVAIPGSAAGDARSTVTRPGRRRAETAEPATASTTARPIVHILIPASYRGVQADEGHGATYSWENMHAGLDGIAIDLPAMNLKPTHGDSIPMNIQIKDPIWPMRDMFDFSFSVKPNTPYTLWLDTRDRILPNGKSLWVAIASASPEFNQTSLEGAHLRLIFKPYDEAKPEHILDRLTEVRDNWSNMVEESVNSNKLNLWNRFEQDITDLFRVDPTNDLGRKYWNEANKEQIHPAFTPPPTPAGVPTWAWLQTQDLKEEADLIHWYVDNRQISDGEFGGGLSDDTDFMNWWPGLALMGVTPDKLRISLERGLDATFNNGMWQNGLARAQYDELHSYEDGINTLGQAMQLDYGNPKQIERAMETAKREAEWLTGYNSAGQRQIKSSYYSGTKMATGGVWGWAKDRSYMVYHPALLLADYNGNPEVLKMITETADGFLAHRHADTPDGKPRMHFTVNFNTNEDLPSGGMTPWFVIWGAYRLTGNDKYLAPFNDDPAGSLRSINSDALNMLKTQDTWGKQLLASTPANTRSDSGTPVEQTSQLAWELTGDTSYLNKVYASQLETAFDKYFINREGSLWIDRVYYNNGELQRGRLGGVALMRNYDYPGNTISWRFAPAANPRPELGVGILVPIGTPTHFKVIGYNLTTNPISAQMLGGEVDPGQWTMTTCTVPVTAANSANTGGVACPAGATTSTVSFERAAGVPVSFTPGQYTVVEMQLKTPGVPYWQRFDLGISADDIKRDGRRLTVTVHSLGAKDAPAAKLLVRDAAGKVIATGNIPALKAPTDLLPKTATVTLMLPAGADTKGATISIQSTGTTPETTLANNTIPL